MVRTVRVHRTNNAAIINARAEQQSAALAAWLAKDKPNPKVYSLGPDYEMGRSTVAAFQKGVKERGGTNLGEVFAPLDSKDYTQYFGQLRASRPQVLIRDPGQCPIGTVLVRVHARIVDAQPEPAGLRLPQPFAYRRQVVRDVHDNVERCSLTWLVQVEPIDRDIHLPQVRISSDDPVGATPAVGIQIQDQNIPCPSSQSALGSIHSGETAPET